MTVGQCIRFIDAQRPNAFSENAKIAWLSQLEGRIATEIFLMAPAELGQFQYSSNTKSYKLLLDRPWDNLYLAYLTAKVDSKNGEFNRLSTAAQAFNQQWNETAAYFANRYEPGKGYYYN